MIFVETPEAHAFFAGLLKPLAKQYRGKINIATVDAKEAEKYAKKLGLEGGKWPALAIDDHEWGVTTPMDQSRDVREEEVRRFFDEFIAAKEWETRKRQEKPASERMSEAMHDEL